jgi:hypothetical protein
MKKILNLFAVFIFFLGSAQIDNIADGESITLRIHYGFLNAEPLILLPKRPTIKEYLICM